MSPTALTLRHLRQDGYAAGVVERYLQDKGIRCDLFRCIDIIGVKPGEPVLGVQATALSCVSARVNKALEIPELATWLAAGARFQIWGWDLVNGRWHPKIIDIGAGNMQATVVRPMPRRRRKSRWNSPEVLFSE